MKDQSCSRPATCAALPAGALALVAMFAIGVMPQPAYASSITLSCAASATTFTNAADFETDLNKTTLCSPTPANVGATQDYVSDFVTPIGEFFDPFKASGTASAYVNGGLGTFHGAASALVERSPNYYSYTSVDSDGNVSGPYYDVTAFQQISSVANATAQWTDAVTFLDPGAAPGTMISFTMSTLVNTGVGACQISNGNVEAQGSAASSVNAYTDIAGATGSLLAAIAYSAGTFGRCQPIHNNNALVTLQVPVGTTIDLVGTFGIVANATLFNPGGLGQLSPNEVAGIVVDAGNTSHFYIDVSTPGAYYTDLTGTNNPFVTPLETTPAPEPGTWVLLGTGLLTVGRRLRRV
jgi:hypothetical protein